MKRILMIITSLLFIICFISCNEEVKIEEINIKFVIEENIYDIKKEVNYIVNIDDIPNITEEDIEGIYYDSEYSNKYNNEVLDKDTVLYVRKVKENIEVTFIVGSIEEVVTMKSNSVVTIDNIPNITEEDIEGIYYDREYINKYNNKVIKNNILLYIKLIDVKKWLIERLDNLLIKCENEIEYNILFIKQKIEKAKQDIDNGREDLAYNIYNNLILDVDKLLIIGEKLEDFKRTYCDIINENRINPVEISKVNLAYYFGAFNNNQVFCLKVDGWGIEEPLKLEIGKYKFEFTKYLIRVMNEEEIYRLDEAYRLGTISDSDLDIIYNMFLMI